MVYEDDNKLYFLQRFPNLISCVGRKAAERWNLLSGVHTAKPLLKTDRSCVSYICGDAWCIAEDSEVDCYGWKQIVIYVNCGFQDRTQSEPLMWTSGTHIVTHANTCKHTHTPSRTPSLCLALFFQPFVLFVMSDSLISSAAWITIL